MPLDVDEVVAAAAAAKANGASRFCMGAAWRGPKDRDLVPVLEMVRGIEALSLETCCTLGMLKDGLACLRGWTAPVRAESVTTHDRQVTYTLGITKSVRKCGCSILRHSYQGKSIRTNRVRDCLEIGDDCLDGYLVNIAIGQPATTRVVADQSVSFAEGFAPAGKGQRAPFLFDVGQPVRNLDNRIPVPRSAMPIRTASRVRTKAIFGWRVAIKRL